MRRYNTTDSIRKKQRWYFSPLSLVFYLLILFLLFVESQQLSQEYEVNKEQPVQMMYRLDSTSSPTPDPVSSTIPPTTLSLTRDGVSDLPTVFPTSSSTRYSIKEGCTRTHVRIEIQTDLCADETSWSLINLFLPKVVADVSYSDEANQFFVYSFCVRKNECHQFRIKDTYGDGLYTPGYYNLYVNDALIASSNDDPGGDFGSSETTIFGCPLSSDSPSIQLSSSPSDPSPTINPRSIAPSYSTITIEPTSQPTNDDQRGSLSPSVSVNLSSFPSTPPSRNLRAAYPSSNPSINPRISSLAPSHPIAKPILSVEPTVEPTAEPTVDPTTDPTAEPTLDPTLQPTVTLNEYTIQNDQVWYDTEGETVWASMGGHISKFDGIYYWVGTDPRINDSSIRIYSSKTLGSNTWKFECYVLKREGTDSEGNKLLGKRNCSLLFCPETQKYVVICKGVTIYESTMTNQIVGSYEMTKTIKARTILSGVVDNVNNYKMGGMSAYYEDGKAYFIISIKNKQTRDRYAIIAETTPNFLDVQRHVLWLPVAPRREAFWLFRRDGKYYMTYDGPGGWMGSDCYYRIADNLEGPWTEEVEISFDPEPTERKMRSHASQHRYIMNVDGQWIYGGDRYPYQEAESHSPEKGLHIMCPIEWDGDHPTVVWEKRWNVNAYS